MDPAGLHATSRSRCARTCTNDCVRPPHARTVIVGCRRQSSSAPAGSGSTIVRARACAGRHARVVRGLNRSIDRRVTVPFACVRMSRCWSRRRWLGRPRPASTQRMRSRRTAVSPCGPPRRLHGTPQHGARASSRRKALSPASSRSGRRRRGPSRRRRHRPPQSDSSIDRLIDQRRVGGYGEELETIGRCSAGRINMIVPPGPSSSPPAVLHAAWTDVHGFGAWSGSYLKRRPLHA